MISHIFHHTILIAPILHHIQKCAHFQDLCYLLDPLHLWQYRLCSFQMGGTKLERFLPKNQHTITAIPYRASTGPEQGFPCVVFPHREKPVFISWDPCNENRFFPDGNTTQGKSCLHYKDRVAVCAYLFSVILNSILY